MSNPQPPYDVEYHGERTITGEQERDEFIRKTTNLWGTHNGRQTKHIDRQTQGVGGEKIKDLYTWAETADDT